MYADLIKQLSRNRDKDRADLVKELSSNRNRDRETKGDGDKNDKGDKGDKDNAERDLVQWTYDTLTALEKNEWLRQAFTTT